MRGSIARWMGLAVALWFVQVTFVSAESPKHDCGDSSGYQPGSPWPVYQRCSTRLGQSAAAGARTPDLNWKVDLYANVDSPTIDAAGNIYVGSGPHLHSISPNGLVRWSSFMWSDIAAAPAIAANGTIYAVSVAGGLAAINPVNGAHIWDYFGAWGWAINTSPLIGPDGTVYFVDANNFVHAVNPDGTPRFVRWFPGPIASSLTLSRTGRSLYIGSVLWGLRSVNTETGNIEWITTERMGEYTTPAVGFDGTIYAGSSDGKLYAVSPLDGKVKWSVENKSLFGLIDNWGPITAAPTIAPSGTIVFGTAKGILVGVDRQGTVVWEKTLSGGLLSNTLSPPPTEADYVALECMDVNTCARGASGERVCWGTREAGDFATSKDFIRYDGANRHACGLREDGSFECFGVLPFGLGEPREESFKDLASGGNFNCGLTQDGAIDCWGQDANGTLDAPSETGFVALDASFRSGCALRANGTAACWGASAYWDTTPSIPLSSVSVGRGFACGLTAAEGRGLCWGIPSGGQTDVPLEES